VVPAAAGGPKGLVLNALDRFVFGHWLPGRSAEGQSVHLIGASIGAWCTTVACLPDADAGLTQLVENCIRSTARTRRARRVTVNGTSPAPQAASYHRFEGVDEPCSPTTSVFSTPCASTSATPASPT
jgi:hypothetical protein